MLEKREKHIEKQSAACREEAKTKLRAKDKRGALFLIKRAKLYDQQITQLYGKRSNLDIQIMALEGAASNSEIFKVMNVGRQALKQATSSVDVDVVGDLMEDLNESLQANEEINDALAQQIGPQMDEDELNAELEEMEQEMVDNQLLAVGAMPQPTAVQQQQQRKDSVREEKAASIPSLPPRPLVSAGGAVVPISNASTNGGGGGGVGRKQHQLDDKEARELKELEALMNS